MLIAKGVIYTLTVFTLLCLAFKKRDTVRLYNIIMFCCWVVIALSMESYDIGNYRYAYELVAPIGKDFFYDMLQLGFSSRGIPFPVFKVIFCTGIWALLYTGFPKYTNAKALAAALFLIGPVIGFGTQLRSSLAGVIVFNALPILLDKKGKIWKYCLWVAVASFFHVMGAFYFVFLLPKLFRGNSEKFRNVLCVIALTMYPLFALAAKPLADLLVALMPNVSIGFVNLIISRIVPYLDGQLSPNLTGLMYNSLAHLILFFAVDRMCVIMIRLHRDGSPGFLDDYVLSYLHKLNSILLLIVPCYMLCPQYDRFHTYFALVAYCIVAQGISELWGSGKKAPMKGFLDLPLVKRIKLPRSRVMRIFVDEKYGLLQPGNFEFALLVSCMAFCFYVGNWHSPEGFLEIIGGIARFR